MMPIIEGITCIQSSSSFLKITFYISSEFVNKMIDVIILLRYRTITSCSKFEVKLSSI